MNDWVVDASVAIKWYVPESDFEIAGRLLEGRDELHVPDLLFPEIGNVLWKKANRLELSGDEVQAILRALEVVPFRVHSSARLLDPAVTLALATGRSVYDSIYVALAVILDCLVITADERLVRALASTPVASHVLLLRDLPRSRDAGDADVE